AWAACTAIYRCRCRRPCARPSSTAPTGSGRIRRVRGVARQGRPVSITRAIADPGTRVSIASTSGWERVRNERPARQTAGPLTARLGPHMFDPARESGVDSSAGVIGALLRVHERGIRYANGEDATRLLDEALAAVMQLLHGDGGWAYILDAHTKRRHLVVCRGCTPEVAGLWDSTGGEQVASDAALTRNDLVVVDDVQTVGTCPELLRRALISAQAVPFHWMPLLASDHEMFGAVSTFSRTRRRPTDCEQHWAKVLVRHTADFIAWRLTCQAMQQSAVRDREARILAEAATLRKDQLLAMVSHELRQPLSAALPAVEVQKHSPSAERRARACDVIEQQLRQMVRLVDDLRD